MTAKTILRYGCRWPAESSELQIEMACIKNGGKWKLGGKVCGEGLPHHFERMRHLLWSDLDDHRWNSLCRDNILKSKVTVLMGPASTGKTHTAAWVSLCDYFVWPEETCVLVSSTDMRGLELRVWGEIKMLFDRAIQAHPWLPGHLIESKHAISTDNVEEEEVRDLRKGIIGVPTVQGGKYIGLGKWVGIKQKRMRLVADDCQFMGASFLSAFANLDKNADFKAIVLGNPNDIMDPLGKAAEPKDGWSSHLEPEKTTVWETRFMNGRCVNLIGTDSPNFDYPQDQPTRYPYLISRQKIENTAAFFSRDSSEFYQQCIGAMKVGVLARRVITRDLCVKFGAMNKVVWAGGDTIKIAGLDAAYGGDRCVGGHIEFGTEVGGKLVLAISPPRIVPIRASVDVMPEDQIAQWVKDYCMMYGIPPENFFHDSTGRGALGTALARVWSAQTNPIDFGGPATPRPVSLDLFVYDVEKRQRRLKLCVEHYSKFVSELWFSVRYAIEAGQIRGLPEDVMEEGCMREWDKVKGDKIEIETKREMKERVGRSPDLFDWLSICVEGARRRGFQISRLAVETQSGDGGAYLRKLAADYAKAVRSHELVEA